VLGGAGPVFCAGFDLDLCEEDSAVSAALMQRLSGAIRALRRLPAPVVAAAHGAAIAGGCALLGGCDVVVTDRGARLGYPVVRLGMSPAVSGPTLAQMVPGGALRRLLLDPGLIDGARALRLGLAHELCDEPGDVTDRAIELAHALARKPPHGLRATKRWLNEIDGSDRDDPFDTALAASLSIAGGPDERARLAAMRGARP
ncbi:MAG: enoyl-CoA hydratase/isomerase family protein, partial [Planctomycetota bacterium]